MAKTLEAAKIEVKNAKEGTFVEQNGFKPVYVKTKYKRNKFTFGVQFWSEFLIRQGWSDNSDGTKARLVEVV